MRQVIGPAHLLPRTPHFPNKQWQNRQRITAVDIPIQKEGERRDTKEPLGHSSSEIQPGKWEFLD